MRRSARSLLNAFIYPFQMAEEPRICEGLLFNHSVSVV